MKLNSLSLSALALIGAGTAIGQTANGYTNFVRQQQSPSGVIRDMNGVAATGSSVAMLGLENGGAMFTLWTVRSAMTYTQTITSATGVVSTSSTTAPLVNYLLDSRYVGAYVPLAEVAITTEDTYIPVRTRADRPFNVNVTTSGIRTEANAPVAAKAVKLLRHVQSYGVNGVGVGLDRTQAILQTQANVTTNSTVPYAYALTSIPGADRTKIRGEERFSVFSNADAVSPGAQLASKTVQIWPMATVTLSGISNGDVIKTTAPPITLQLTDLYPDSKTYARIYPGAPNVDVTATSVVPGSSVVVYEAVPQNRTLVLNDWARDANTDGVWTIEVITETPFGKPFNKERLLYKTVVFDRTTYVNGMITTLEK